MMSTEAAGHLAERGPKGKGQRTQSNNHGHPVHYDDMSDASTVSDDSVTRVSKY